MGPPYTHVKYGTPTSLRTLPYLRMCACKICCKSWFIDYESMLTYLDIPSLQQRRLQLLKANMVYQFVHGGSFIPEGLLLPHPPPTTICEPFSISLYVPFSFFPHMLRFWNSLSTSVVCAQSSFIATVVRLGSRIVLAFAISWTMLVCRTS